MKANIIVTKDLRENSSVNLLEDVRVLQMNRCSVVESLGQMSYRIDLECKLGEKLVNKTIQFSGLNNESSNALIKWYSNAISDLISQTKDVEFNLHIDDFKDKVNFTLKANSQVFMEKKENDTMIPTNSISIECKKEESFDVNKISTLIPGYHNNNVSITCLEDNIAILENKISYIEFDRKTHILTVQEYANMPFDSIYKVKLDYPLKGREQCWLAEELIKSINENKVLSVKFNHEFKSGNIDPLEGDQGTDSLCIIIEKKPNVPKQQWNLKRLYYLNLKLGGIIDACDIDFSNREDVIKSSDNTSYFAKKRDNLQQLSDAVKDYAKKTHKVFGQNNRHMNYDHSDKLYGSFASKIKEDYDALSKIEKE